jgi:pseudouridine kinase
MTMVGNDQYGEMILALGSSAGIDMQYTQTTHSAPTSSYLSVVDETGDMSVAIADMGIMEHITPDWLSRQRDAFERASMIVIEANLPRASVEWVTTEFSHCPIFADTVSASKAPALKKSLGAIHTLKTNALEAQSLAGADASLEAIADTLHGKGIERLFITRGGDGVFYSTPDGSGDVSAPHSKGPMHNSGGAGDAFLAGICYAWLAEWPLADTISFAMAAAEVTAAARATSSTSFSLAAINRALGKRDA